MRRPARAAAGPRATWRPAAPAAVPAPAAAAGPRRAEAGGGRGPPAARAAGKDVAASSSASTASVAAEEATATVTSALGELEMERVDALAAARAAERGAAEARAGGEGPERRPLKVLVAGGGIGGLTAALALQARGVEVKVFEKVREYKPFGGPIQLQSNALAALETIDRRVAAAVIREGTVTGDRVNGLLDGKTGEWYARFNTQEPARKAGLPLTLVINRSTLLDILRGHLADGVVETGMACTGYEKRADGTVAAAFADGSTEVGDVLVAADGIKSAVRQQMKGGGDEAYYSGYTCYTATCEYTPADVDTVGYQVYLGYRKYFVSSDVGDGLTQFYAFDKRASGSESDRCMKAELEELFAEFCPDVQARIAATRPEDIERRDIFERVPSLFWLDGPVALLGDSAHAMQPNLGQGGCQAVEDAYVLAYELDRCAAGEASKAAALNAYQLRRVARAASVQGLAGFAALMTTTWRPYLGSDPYDFYPEPVKAFWRRVAALKIPHPGKVVGQIAMMLSIQTILEYVAGANPVPATERAPYCQLPGAEGNPAKRNIPAAAWKMKGIPGFAN